MPLMPSKGPLRISTEAWDWAQGASSYSRQKPAEGSWPGKPEERELVLPLTEFKESGTVTITNHITGQLPWGSSLLAASATLLLVPSLLPAGWTIRP